MVGVETLDRFFAATLIDSKLPVSGYSVTAVKDNKIVYRKVGGRRRIDWQHPENDVDMTVDTRFRIASISKMFTAVAIMQLMDQGKLSLDGDAGKYLGFALRNPDFPDMPITVRMLLSHVSSLRNGDFYNFPSRYALEEVMLPEGKFWDNGSRYAKRSDKYDVSPGRFFTYSDLNYVLLAGIIEKVSGERFDLYERDHVLQPMGISGQFNPALFNADEIKLVAPAYRKLKDGKYDPTLPWLPQYDDYNDQVVPENIIYYNNPYKREPPKADDLSGYIVGTNPSVFNPAGGLRINTEELTRFIRMMMNGGVSVTGERIISPEAVREMTVPCWVAGRNGVVSLDRKAYACGVTFIAPQYGGDRIVEGRDDAWVLGHSGSANGLYSGCWWNPEKNFGFAFAYTGTGNDPEIQTGHFSSRFRIIEETLENIYKFLEEC